MNITMQRIVFELKAQHKSQTELAEYIGVKPNSITEWKAGRNTAYKKYLFAIASFLGVSVEYLKGETDQKESPAPDNSDETLLFALYGDDHADITPDMLAEIKEIAQVIRNRRKKDDQ